MSDDVEVQQGSLLSDRARRGRPRADSRVAFQVATAEQFVAAVEAIVDREVRAFGSAVDTREDVVFANFVFESRANSSADETPATWAASRRIDPAAGGGRSAR